MSPSYKNVMRWADEIFARPAFQRGRIVNRTHGPAAERSGGAPQRQRF